MGVRVAVLKSVEKLIVNETGVAVFEVTYRVTFPVLGSKLSGFMALLNCIFIVEFSATPVAPLVGVIETMVGLVRSTPEPVVNALVVVPSIVFPTKSCTPAIEMV